jgi:2-polyprenyl-3-methyl-5-hydroxy-6-metoxy-1,4-benzoquinol methylase
MEELGWQVEGVDFDDSAVRIGRTKGLKVHLGNLLEQEFSGNAFDVVTLSHVIEHVHDPVALLRECYRILKPGGQAVIVTPNASSWGHRLYGGTWRGLEPPRHLHIFSPASSKAVLTAAGFSKIRLSTTIRDASTIFIASRSVCRTGRYEMGIKQSRRIRYWGATMQAIEWARLKIDPQAGEEIAAIAQK